MANKKLTDKTMVAVYSNTNGTVFYHTELNRTKRVWNKIGSSKNISLEELRELVGSAGGYELLIGDLLIKDNDVREELGLPVEKSYVLDEAGIRSLLAGSLDELQSVLNDTTDTIKENIARIAITDKLADLNKLEAIKDASGVDVLLAIQEAKEDEKAKNKSDNK